MRRNLTRVERLKTKSDFARVFNKPEIKSGCRGAKLIAKRNGLRYNRFAATVVKKYGNSVERNYARRILKEVYRNNKQNLPVGYDIIAILYPGEFSYYERERQITNLFWKSDFTSTVF